SRRGGPGSSARQRTARPRDHRQRGGARPGVDGAIPEGQDRGTDRAVPQACPARAPRAAGRHRRRDLVPGWPRGRLGERASAAGQWWLCVSLEPSGQGGRSMKDVIVVTGTSSGFGALAARALARAGHTVYASMRETTGRNAPQVAEARQYAAEHAVDLRTIELDVASEASADAAIEEIVTAHGRHRGRSGDHSAGSRPLG